MPKPSSITIHLPEPCSESWDKMKPNGCGRFCMHCEKTVIDFTQMTDEEVVKVMVNATNIPCGRFDEKQLNRPIAMPQTKRAKPFPYLFSKVAASFLLMQTLVNNAFAQKAVQADTEQVSGAASSPKKNLIIIEGTIKDNSSDEPLIGMEISVSGLDYVKYSDVKGGFRFTLPDSFKGRKVIVSASYQSSSSKELDGTNIADQEIVLSDESNIVKVQLKRYPYQQWDKEIISSPYGPPITGKTSYVWSSKTVSHDDNTRKRAYKGWLHDFFKKKR